MNIKTDMEIRLGNQCIKKKIFPKKGNHFTLGEIPQPGSSPSRDELLRSPLAIPIHAELSSQ